MSGLNFYAAWNRNEYIHVINRLDLNVVDNVTKVGVFTVKQQTLNILIVGDKT